jgi:hypothetical protein
LALHRDSGESDLESRRRWLIAVGDAQRERAEKWKPGAPCEGDSVDRELLDRGKAKRSPPGFQHHLALLANPDPAGRTRLIRKYGLDVTAHELRQRARSHRLHDRVLARATAAANRQESDAQGRESAEGWDGSPSRAGGEEQLEEGHRIPDAFA